MANIKQKVVIDGVWEDVVPVQLGDNLLASDGSWKPTSLAAYNKKIGYKEGSAEAGIASDGSSTQIYTDGYFWQREGSYKCLDTGSSLSSSKLSGSISSTLLPSAAYDANGIVTTGDQTFKGYKNIRNAMSDGTTAFLNPHLKFSATNSQNTTGFVGITFATSASDGYGYSLGALRSSGGQGKFRIQRHNGNNVGSDVLTISEGGTVTAPIFSGALSGNATSADTATTADNSKLLDGIESSHFVFGQNGSGALHGEDAWSQSDPTQYKAGYWDAEGADWTPDSNWWWGQTLAHTSNSPTYLYGAQMAFSNSTSPIFKYRGLAGGSNGSKGNWKTVANLETGQTFTGSNTFNLDTTFKDYISVEGVVNSTEGLDAINYTTSIGTKYRNDKMTHIGTNGTYDYAYPSKSGTFAMTNDSISDSQLPASITSSITGNAATSSDSSKLNGYVSTDADTASTVVRRNGSKDINVRLVRSTYGNQSNISGGIMFRVNNTTDNYNRVCSSPSAIKTWLSAADASHTHTIANVTSLQTTLDAKAGIGEGNTFTQSNTFNSPTDFKDYITIEGTATATTGFDAINYAAGIGTKYDYDKLTYINDNGTYNYAYPTKSGTLALTSDVSDLSSQLWPEIDDLADNSCNLSNINSSMGVNDAVVYIGSVATNNQAGMVFNNYNSGSPQIGLTDHGDMSWAIGGDDGDNSFKIHGVATSTIPTINGLTTPHFEITTGGIIYNKGIQMATIQDAESPFYTYTSNINGGSQVTISNIANARYADVTVKFYTGQAGVARIYLDNSDDSNSDNYYGAVMVPASDNQSNYYYSVFYIDKSANVFRHNSVGYKNGSSSTATSRNANSSYRVTTIRFYK